MNEKFLLSLPLLAVVLVGFVAVIMTSGVLSNNKFSEKIDFLSQIASSTTKEEPSPSSTNIAGSAIVQGENGNDYDFCSELANLAEITNKDVCTDAYFIENCAVFYNDFC